MGQAYEEIPGYYMGHSGLLLCVDRVKKTHGFAGVGTPFPDPCPQTRWV
jgi:hypothetical protein